MENIPLGSEIEKLFFGRNRAADLIDVSSRTIDEAIRTGRLEAYKLGRRVLIPKDSLVQFAKRIRIKNQM
jgi:excisionase family DNA binding protein